MLRCPTQPQCGRAPLRHHGRRESPPSAAPGVVVRCARGAPQVSRIEAASPVAATTAAAAAKAERGDARPSLAERLRLGSLLEDGLSYKEIFIVRSYEVGINKTATVETIANLLQEVGCSHAQSLGFSTDGFATTTSMRKLGLIWVTNRMHIEIYKYPAWGDVVEIETWCQADGRMGTRRDWILKDLANGEVIGRATRRVFFLISRRGERVPHLDFHSLWLLKPDSLAFHRAASDLHDDKVATRLDRSSLNTALFLRFHMFQQHSIKNIPKCFCGKCMGLTISCSFWIGQFCCVRIWIASQNWRAAGQAKMMCSAM
ncbi:oleoyl-acyl carrier protein thioesterase 1, chloroplastic isoform X3 [Sorghum bicolor]|uniref:oleoyl-acyl carrier protein thioesterase 1, chloroplastic isoform X3 n=1 Tax=Sorghum bicolor TaxID=4558 RepID=UPI000B423898|nr:oleoyl-acyl carrier protein thioesterase 1, chloroplastic isoform X3 [Sorghum bicolor]|eukprot:XP_021309489.1 oleoyl-acyl carrier protein thioesterase 1, chloroplastic isoform X3 [Sorghum bicolor]